MSEKLNIGVVGYCPPSRFDENEARRMINEGYDQFQERHPGREIRIISGLTNVGVLKIAYEEARKRRWEITGITNETAAREYELFPVDSQTIVGKTWGDESQTFVDAIDGILRVGGGPQSKREVQQIRERGGEVIEFELEKILDTTRTDVTKTLK